MIVSLSPSERAHIFRTPREERSSGGFQSFMVKLQDRMNNRADGALELEDTDVETIRKYLSYDNGGYQARLREAFGRHLPQLFPGYRPSMFNGVEPQ